jgi:peptidylprolyl isomerase
LDEAFAGFEVGKANTIELPPEKAYGVRDPKKVRLVPLRKFTAEGLTPVPGLEVNIDGKVAQVRAVGAGRVQVDYNHPFAGKTLVYDVTVEKIIETDEEKVKNLLRKRLPSVDQEKFSVNLENGKLQVEIPEEAFFLEGLQVAKQTITADIGRFFPKIETVAFMETFKKPPTTPPPTTEPAEVTAPAATTPAPP